METIKIQGKSYAMVVERVKEFNKQFPDGSLITEIISNEDGVVIMKASAIVNGIVLGTGHSFETVGSSQINKSSHLENCETSAIGRCLALCSFSIRLTNTYNVWTSLLIIYLWSFRTQ
mgnify:CR=1 FL=1